MAKTTHIPTFYTICTFNLYLIFFSFVCFIFSYWFLYCLLLCLDFTCVVCFPWRVHFVWRLCLIRTEVRWLFGQRVVVPRRTGEHFCRLLLVRSTVCRIGRLFCRAIASRSQQRLSFGAPTNRRFGMFPGSVRRKFLLQPQRSPWDFPCTWMPFCFRWFSSLSQLWWRSPICTRSHRRATLRRNCPCHRSCWWAHRWFPLPIRDIRQPVLRCISNWSVWKEIWKNAVVLVTELNWHWNMTEKLERKLK